MNISNSYREMIREAMASARMARYWRLAGDREAALFNQRWAMQYRKEALKWRRFGKHLFGEDQR